MTTQSLRAAFAARVVAAAIAAATTAVLFSAVVSIGEPGHSRLLALNKTRQVATSQHAAAAAPQHAVASVRVAAAR